MRQWDRSQTSNFWQQSRAFLWLSVFSNNNSTEYQERPSWVLQMWSNRLGAGAPPRSPLAAPSLRTLPPLSSPVLASNLVAFSHSFHAPKLKSRIRPWNAPAIHYHHHLFDSVKAHHRNAKHKTTEKRATKKTIIVNIDTASAVMTRALAGVGLACWVVWLWWMLCLCDVLDVVRQSDSSSGCRIPVTHTTMAINPVIHPELKYCKSRTDRRFVEDFWLSRWRKGGVIQAIHVFLQTGVCLVADYCA